MTDQIPSLIDRLQTAARAAREHAHAPYSKFKVGAAVLDEQGRIFAGCNVENAAYPLGTCAEAVALGAMVASGGKTCSHVLIIGGDGDLSPCGGCRQRIAELCTPDCVVYAVASDGSSRTERKMADLLPYAFQFDR